MKLSPELYQLALGFLYYQEPAIEAYVATLKEESKYFPELNDLAEILEMAGPAIQKRFISEVSRSDQAFIKLILTRTIDRSYKPYYQFGKLIIDKMGDAGLTLQDQASTLTNIWRNSQWFSPIISRIDNRTIVNEDISKDLLKDLKELNSLNSTAVEFKTKGLELIYKTLELNAITIPRKAIDELANNTLKWTKGTSLAGGFDNLFAIAAADQKPLGIISAIILKLNGFKNSKDSEIESSYLTAHAANNPLYTEKDAMRILGRIGAYYSPIVDPSFFSKRSTSETFYY